MGQSAIAPEQMRRKVNEAASILVCFSAARQRSELLAKAIIARRVRIKVRALKPTIVHNIKANWSTSCRAIES